MKKKINSIQALRALACMCVFFYHCFSKTIVSWGVSIFFYLSGFLLVYRHLNSEFSTDKADFKFCLSFACVRIRKIYPLYILSMLPILALELYSILNSLSDDTLLFTAKKFLAVALMIQSWIPNNHYVFAFNGIGWYVSSAFFTYLIFPFILRRIRNYKNSKSPFFAIGIIFTVMVILGFAAPYLASLESRLNIPSDDSFEMWFTYNFPPFRALEFAIGCNIGCIFAKADRESSKKAIAITDILCVALFLAAWSIYRFSDSIFASDAFKHSQLFAPFCIVFLCAFVMGKGIISKIFTNTATVFLGNISGWFFIIHMDVMKFYHIFAGIIGLSAELINIFIVPVVGAVTILLSLGYNAIIKKYSS